MTTLDRGSVRLFHDECGDGDPTLLLVHGWSGDHTHFAPQSARFSSTHRVVSVDLRGHGASDSPEQEYTIDGFADDLAWLCEQLGAHRVVPVGHSMGGSVSIALAATHPELVSAVVLVDSPLVWPDAIKPLLRQGAEAMAGPDGFEVRRALVDSFFIDEDDCERRAALSAQMLRTPGHVASSAFLSISSFDLNESASRVKAPVLALMAGTMALSIEDHFPSGVVDSLTIGRTVGAGHYIQLEVPEQVNAMIERFLFLHGLG